MQLPRKNIIHYFKPLQCTINQWYIFTQQIWIIVLIFILKNKFKASQYFLSNFSGQENNRETFQCPLKLRREPQVSVDILPRNFLFVSFGFLWKAIKYFPMWLVHFWIGYMCALFNHHEKLTSSWNIRFFCHFDYLQMVIEYHSNWSKNESEAAETGRDGR